MITKDRLFSEYVEACNYPGKLDEDAVELHLGHYLQALGVTRKIVRLRRGWRLEDHPSLERSVNLILDDITNRTGWKPNQKDAIAARTARTARDELQSFAQWCIQAWGLRMLEADIK